MSFSGIFISSCERMNVAGLHFICLLFPNSLAYHQRDTVIKPEEKNQSLSTLPFFLSIHQRKDVI